MANDACRHTHFVEPEGTTDLSEGFLTRELAPGVYMLTNANYQTMFMTTGEGVILVDAPQPLVQYIEKAIADVTDERLSTIIYSHGHSDHIGGTADLMKPGIELIGEERIAKFLEQKKDSKRPVPTRTFSETTTIHKGTRTIEIKRDEFHSPEGDLVIYLPQEKVLMAVDLIAPGWVPLLDFDITGNMFVYLSAFDRILAYDFDAFICGHTSDIARRHDLEITKKYAFDVYETVKRIHTEMNKPELLTIDRDNEQAGLKKVIDDVVEKSYEEVKSRWLNGPMKGVDTWSESHCRAMVLYIRWSD